MGMGIRGTRVTVVVRPGASARRSSQVVTWIRALLPAAVLLIGGGAAASPPDVGDAEDVITLDVDGVESGPLSVADALARVRRR